MAVSRRTAFRALSRDFGIHQHAAGRTLDATITATNLQIPDAALPGFGMDNKTPAQNKRVLVARLVREGWVIWGSAAGQFPWPWFCFLSPEQGILSWILDAFSILKPFTALRPRLFLLVLVAKRWSSDALPCCRLGPADITEVICPFDVESYRLTAG